MAATPYPLPSFKPLQAVPWVHRVIFVTSLLALSFSAYGESAVSLNFWAVSGSYQDVDMFKRLARNFEEKSGIHVDVTPLGWGNFETKYLTAMAAGVPPDVGVTNLGGPVDYGRVGGVVDLTATFPEEMAQFKEEFFQNLLNGFIFKGHLFGLPASITTLSLFYRTDIFARLEIKPPTTWAELEEAIRKLEAAGYRYGFGWTRGDSWGLNLYSQPYGLAPIGYTPDGKPIADWKNPVFEKVVQRVIKLWYLHDLGDRALQGSRFIALFKLDNPGDALPMILDLSFIYNAFPIMAPEINGKWDILPWPKAEDGEAFNIVGGTAYVIFRKSPHQKEAFEWLKYLNSLEAQREMMLDNINRGEDSIFMVSPIRAMWGPENDSFWDRPELEGSRRIKEVMAQVVETFAPTLPVLGGPEAGRLLDQALDRMGTSALDGLSTLASRKGMSRWELVQAFARGEYPDEYTQLKDLTDQAVSRELGAVVDKGQAILERETRVYEERYGNIIDQLATIEQEWDFLMVMEIGAALFLGGLLLLVLLFPGPRKNVISYLFIAPPVVSTLVFMVVPAAVALYLSFTDYMPVLPLATAKWVGVKHFVDLLLPSGPVYDSLGKTLFYAAGMLPVQILLALILAALLNNQVRGQRYWRFLYFSPMVTSVVSVSLIFVALFQGARYGWVNAALLRMGILDDIVIFLDNERTFLSCVVVLAIWQGLAFNIIIFLAGLQQIPDQLYEAAEVDGAGWYHRFLHITLPGLQPQIFFTLIVGGIWSFQVFEPIYMLGGGAGEAGTKFGPNNAGLTLVPLIYQAGFEDFHMGRASAIAYIMFALILGLTLFQVKMLRREKTGS